MTKAALEEGQKLERLINDYTRTLDYFTSIKDEKELKEEIAKFLTATQMIPYKDQMALIMKNAVIESCKLCIKQAQEKFESL